MHTTCLHLLLSLTCTHTPPQIELSAEHYEKYLTLMCKADQSNVLAFLHENAAMQYLSSEACMGIVRAHGILEGQAFLLERSGDVTTAHSLMLKVRACASMSHDLIMYSRLC